MLFSSPVFLFLFLPLLLGAYFCAHPGLRNPLLLAASLLFYAWGEGPYLVILLCSIAFNYGLGMWLDGHRRRWQARVAITLAVGGNLALLVSFKYANFLVNNLNPLLAALGLRQLDLAPVHLPLGISFFTFHALSYVIDIYRREVRALRNPVNFALYIAFFPQSIAGPIVRYADVAGQILGRVVSLEGFAEGVRRFVIGLGKKMLVANTAATAADAVFGLPEQHLTAKLAWLGVICYTVQIYFDFSGYSDMAIGLARMFGFRFRENFEHPYVAQSITEFWRRWHISLSSWFRDYLYIPLGGNRRGRLRLYFNLVTVFFLCGLWHGASWCFLVWGLFHGAFLVLERTAVGALLDRAVSPLRHAYTLVVVMAGWVFFRSESLAHAGAVLAAMAGQGHGDGIRYYPELYLNRALILALAVGVVGAMPVVPSLARFKDRLLALGRGQPLWQGPVQALFSSAELAAYLLLLAASSAQLAAGTYNPFIYFRF
jgi:alginate O-acetyltransferase complex protein AlgI